MADVGVVHPDLSAGGGAEAVCMAALELLQEDHDVTLLTLSDPDLEALNEYHGRTVVPEAIRIRTVRTPAVDLLGRGHYLTDRLFGVGLGRLQMAVLYRQCKARTDAFDLLVSTFNELGPTGNSLQYVHHPLFDGSVMPGVEGDDDGLDRLYKRLCRRVVRIDRDGGNWDDEVVVNSDWTGDVIERSYGVQSRTVYPPVEVDDKGRPWAERESGIVTVGRLSTDKNVLETVDIVRQLRECGHDVHQHVVGPPFDPSVTQRIRAAAEEHDWLSYEGRVDRSTLTALMGRHRYGLHGKRYEHFGMVVAEFLARGAVPVVPNAGGQREVVGGETAVLYDTSTEAVEKLDRLLGDDSRARAVRESLPDAERRFGPERFRTEFRRAVAEALE